jgi:hypothetical protein
MKLGTQTGSVVNHLHSLAVIGQPEPVVGMGVTLLGWNDRHAGTIQNVYVKSGVTFIEVTRDDFKLIAGSAMSEDQTYEFTPNPRNPIHMFRRLENGMWQEVRYKFIRWDGDEPIYSTRPSKVPSGGMGLRIGVREKYLDPSF